MKNAIKVLLNIAFKVLLTTAKRAIDPDDDDELLPSPDLPGSDDPIAGDPDVDLNPVTEEMFSSWALFIMLLLLISALWSSYYLTQKRIRAVHETVLSIFYGMVIGLIIRMSPGIIFKIRLLLIHPTSLMFYCRQLF